MKRLLFVVLVLAFVLPGCRGAFPFLFGAAAGSLITYEATRPRTVVVAPAQSVPPCPPDTPPEECLNANAGVPPEGYILYPGTSYYYYPYSPYPLFWYGGYFYGFWGGYWHGRYGYHGYWGAPHYMPRGMSGFHRGYTPRGGGYRGGGGGRGYGGGHGGGHGGHGGHR